MAKKHTVATFLRQNSLSIALFSLFFLFLGGLSVTGWQHENEQLLQHGQPTMTYIDYIGSGEFIEAVFENWESEFLQMWALVMLTIYLRQRGSADSKKLRGHEAFDTSAKYSVLHGKDWQHRSKAFGSWLYANSLGLVLLALFIISFSLHALGGLAAYNSEVIAHHEPQISLVDYVTSSTFWFESFQNWQSEFLAVGSLLVLSVFLRQRGSPESKPIGASNSATGGSS